MQPVWRGKGTIMKARTASGYGLVIFLLMGIGSVTSGCGKGSAASKEMANTLSNKLAAIRQAGQPVSLQELNDRYVAPPEAENAAALYAGAFER